MVLNKFLEFIVQFQALELNIEQIQASVVISQPVFTQPTINFDDPL